MATRTDSWESLCITFSCFWSSERENAVRAARMSRYPANAARVRGLYKERLQRWGFTSVTVTQWDKLFCWLARLLHSDKRLHIVEEAGGPARSISPRRKTENFCSVGLISPTMYISPGTKGRKISITPHSQNLTLF